jgi:undecaprenyl phosphate-alpha-L-ara4N flippase subunit ArnF
MTPSSQRFLGIVLLASSIVLSSVGQLCMKVGMQELKQSAVALAPTWTALSALHEPLLFTVGGLLAYAISMLAWLAVLVRYPLSYAYPFLSLSYVLVYIGATHWSRLMETATPLRTAGTLLILVGVVLVSRTEGRAAI